MENHIASLAYLLYLPLIRRRILENVSAFDAAKLVELKLCVLTAKEKETYLKPLRDLVWDVPAVERLSQEGMKLMFLGYGANVLEQRLHATGHYLNSHGNRRLAIYIVGTFPLLAPTETTLDSLVGFSITGHASLVRSHGDKYQLGRIRALGNRGAERVFIMSFNAPMRASPRLAKGFWYKIDDVPNRTVDLWVYVPSFRDRIREEVRLTPLDILRIVRASLMAVPPPLVPLRETSDTFCMKRMLCNAATHASLYANVSILALIQLFCFCVESYRLRKWSFAAAGIGSIAGATLAQLPNNKSHVYQLLAPLKQPTVSLNSHPRTAIAITQAPDI